MNPIAEEMMSYYGIGSDESIEHYGMPRRSGRYPWGSGEDPYQRNGGDFISRVEALRKSNFKWTDENGVTWDGDKAIYKSMGLNSSQFRTEIGIAKAERRALQVNTAKSLKQDGLNTSEIARKMNVNESTVRNWFNEKAEGRMNEARNTADFLKSQVDQKKMVDVGIGVENDLKVTRTKMDQALYLLQREGYEVYSGRFNQVNNPGRMTTQKVLCVPGTKHNEIYDLDKVQTIMDYTSHDEGKTFSKFQYPKSMDPSRLMIRYKEDGGIDKDGIVELRRGVDDLSLGEKRYAQVRILVDNDRYIKGMAVYSDDMPKGVDVVFNTNKTKDIPMRDVLKKIKDDPDNPFGSLIKPQGQSTYIDKNGKEQLSLINRTRDEGDWSDWKDALPSQFLSKQSISLAKKQLKLARESKQIEYETICSLENPTLKKHYLQSFAESCDSSAINLQAAALPGQKYHVIVPMNSLKDSEVYAPRYENGTQIALIRYPHGGTFEIPILTVNNKHAASKKLLGSDVSDAIAINSKNAERLSGADFDGDTVMCIPTHNGKVKIASTKELDGLKGFDPKAKYQYDEVQKDADGKEHYYRNGVEFRKMTKTDTEMGRISNLITDMTLAGATTSELARAVRHSMVVIDAEKHCLDYKQSELDNNIAALRREYQEKTDAKGRTRYGGATTLISRAKGEYDVVKRKGSPYVNIKGKPDYDPSRPEGALIYKTDPDADYSVAKVSSRAGTVPNATIRVSKKGRAYAEYDDDSTWVPLDGKNKYRDGDRVSATTTVKQRMQKSTNMAETDDAYTLVSKARHPMEEIYADHANALKAMANRARKEQMATGKIAYNKEAAAEYKDEVQSLNSKLNNAEKNITRERAANRKAAAEVAAKREANPGLKNKDVKKLAQQALNRYRNDYGSVKRSDRSINITDREWDAIQAGAISESKLKRILNQTDADKLRDRAMPRTKYGLSASQISKIKSMRASDYSLSEIARSLGVSTSTVSDYIKGVS